MMDYSYHTVQVENKVLCTILKDYASKLDLGHVSEEVIEIIPFAIDEDAGSYTGYPKSRSEAITKINDILRREGSAYPELIKQLNQLQNEIDEGYERILISNGYIEYASDTRFDWEFPAGTDPEEIEFGAVEEGFYYYEVDLKTGNGLEAYGLRHFTADAEQIYIYKINSRIGFPVIPSEGVTKKEINLKKAEEEKKLAMMLKAQAEERARVEKIELEKKKKQEELKKQEEKAKEVAAWQAAVDQINKNRKAEEERLLKQYESEYTLAIEAIHKTAEEDTAAKKAEIKALQDKIEREKLELSNLGLFSFGKKKQLNKSIESDSKELPLLEMSLDSIGLVAEQEANEAKEKWEKQQNELKKKLDKEFILPDSPDEIERKRLAEEKRKARLKEEEAQLKVDKERCLSILRTTMEYMSTFEIKAADSYFKEYSPQRMSKILEELKKEGVVEKVMYGRRAKYRY